MTIIDSLLILRMQTEALTSAAVRTTDKLGAKLVLAFTKTGRTARFIAKYRTAVPILVVRWGPLLFVAIEAVPSCSAIVCMMPAVVSSVSLTSTTVQHLRLALGVLQLQ
jgi:pyruvate kinase